MLPNQQDTDSRLTRVEVTVDRIEKQIANLAKEFTEFKCRLEEMVSDHQIALYGDKGKPGLVGQTGTLEELRVALKGYGEEPGLIAKIQTLNKQMDEKNDTQKWIVRLILAAIVGDILLHVFGG